jgi:hypothetical protein
VSYADTEKQCCCPSYTMRFCAQCTSHQMSVPAQQHGWESMTRCQLRMATRSQLQCKHVKHGAKCCTICMSTTGASQIPSHTLASLGEPPLPPMDGSIMIAACCSLGLALVAWSCLRAGACCAACCCCGCCWPC